MNSDDPKFTAHVLGECEDLTAAECAEIEALLASDPVAASEAAETQALAARLRAELPGEAAAGLEEGQRAAVLKAAASAAPAARVVPFPRRATVLAAMAASVVVAVTAGLVYRQLRDLPLVSPGLPPVAMAPAKSSLGDSKVILPAVPSSMPAQQVQFGNITLAGSGNDHVSTLAMETPGASPQDAMARDWNANSGATLIDAGISNAAPATFVSTTPTLHNPVNQRVTYQPEINGFETGTARLGVQSVTVVSATIQTTTSGSLSFYTGSTVTIGSMNANSAGNQPLSELGRRDRTTSLATGNSGEFVKVNETSAGKNFAGTVSGTVGSNTPSFAATTENAFLDARENPLSTFGRNVGTASYALVRRYLEGHQRPPQDAVRIEELLNYFTYDYPPPQADAACSATMEVAECPWMPEHRLARIGVRVARDVNVQVEFNPAQVGAYRLIGYEGRSGAKNADLRDPKEAGKIGGGHTVTALYELVPAGKESPPLAEQESRGTATTAGAAAAMPAPMGRELLRLTLQDKAPDGDTSKRLVFPLTDSGTTWEKSSPDFRFAAAVAGYGMLLRDSSYRGQATWESVAAWAREGLGPDVNGSRAELLDLIEKAKALSP